MSNLYLVHWRGPYGFEEAMEHDHNGIYLVHGRKRFGPEPSEYRPLYVGKAHRSGGVGARLKEHEGRAFQHANNSWWLGRLMSPDAATDADVRAVEAVLIWAVGPECNDRGMYHPPRHAACVISHWYTPGDERRYKNIDAMGSVPDVVTWDLEHFRIADRLQKPWWERS